MGIPESAKKKARSSGATEDFGRGEGYSSFNFSNRVLHGRLHLKRWIFHGRMSLAEIKPVRTSHQTTAPSSPFVVRI